MNGQISCLNLFSNCNHGDGNRKRHLFKLSTPQPLALYLYWYYNVNYYIAIDFTDNDDKEDGIKDKSRVNFYTK
jgi:hypothetical protein